MMRDTIIGLLDEWIASGRMDFEEMASCFPISNMFRLVGAPREEISGIRSSLETLGLAFSLGKPMGLGQHIARAQLQEALHLIPQRIRQPRLDGPVGWRSYPGACGLKCLPIAFTPA